MAKLPSMYECDLFAKFVSPSFIHPMRLIQRIPIYNLSQHNKIIFLPVEILLSHCSIQLLLSLLIIQMCTPDLRTYRNQSIGDFQNMVSF